MTKVLLVSKAHPAGHRMSFRFLGSSVGSDYKSSIRFDGLRVG